MGPKEKIEIALLFSDLKDAKEISNIFKDMGVVPHFYDDLKGLWYGALEKLPAFCLVDVKKMSEGDLFLGDHPMVQNERLTLSFFYSEESYPLVHSTFEMFNIGLVRRSASYKGQLKALIKRYRRIKEVEKSNRALTYKAKKLERQISSIIGAVEGQKEEKFYLRRLKSMLLQFEDEKRGTEDFFQACVNVFEKRDEITEFGMLELSGNGQKLISPDSDNKKYKKIPSLWLGQASRNGIEFFAQNMANQVGADLIGGHLMSLMVKGKSDNPDRILFLQTTDEDMIENFDWELMESFLGGVYSHFAYSNEKKVDKADKMLAPWELLTHLDGYFFDVFDEEEGDDIISVDLDFSEMVDFIRTTPSMRFYWKKFFNEFLNRLESSLKIEFKATSFNVYHMNFIVDKSSSNHFFQGIKSFSARFPYWRFFENVDIVMARTLRPKVKMVPLSAEACLNVVDGVDTYRASERKRNPLDGNKVGTLLQDLKKELRPQGPSTEMTQ